MQLCLSSVKRKKFMALIDILHNITYSQLLRFSVYESQVACACEGSLFEFDGNYSN